MTKNQIDYYKVEEERRHNQVTEREQRRSNLANEALKQESNAISWQSNAINDAHYSRMDSENVRHDTAVETETKRHNIAVETIDWFKADSQDKLNQSNISLNAVYSDKAWAETEKLGTDRMLDLEKVVTEGKTQDKLQSEIDLNKQKAQTEKWNTTLTYGQAGLTALDVMTYNNRRTLSVLQWAGNTNSNLSSNLIGAGSRIWSAIISKRD